MDYSYECTKATIRKDLGVDASGDRMLFCELEFQNEHGHPMQTQKAIVVLRDYGATIVSDAENILGPLSAKPSDEELFSWSDRAEELGEMLDSGDIGFDIYNQEEIAEALRLQLAVAE